MPLSRLLRLDRLAGWFARLPRSLDTPPAAVEAGTTTLVTQFPLEESTRVAQSLLDGGGLKAGQTVMIEGHRAMTVTVEEQKVVLVPREETAEAQKSAENTGPEKTAAPQRTAEPVEPPTPS
ncbi:hypothetical protein GRS96_18465 [Rathayibacter sp. VKM Ac-2803]|uniref:hypothetical protein n=1 Tax=unclassified Rathayibacter TaxID=2609250 RepID=UPI00135A5902|nr:MULTISPECIES: hypothetical protein [unclassified Rathayibacter]MWV51258.1 hypothetical protein [Rathayibacter sp. VKM Ac-2803]MWV57744.1 hypothetical protein [Rathayibacter sp. VKM Ac-2754]